MQPSKWQDEFHSHPEDRLFSKKASLFSFDNPFKYLSVFIGSVVAIGIIWYVSTSSPSLPDDELPTVQAPQGPFKIKPALQESDRETLQNKTIYEKLSARNPDEKVEHLLKEPEEPIAPPPSLPEKFIGSLMDEEDLGPSASFSQSVANDTPGVNTRKGIEKEREGEAVSEEAATAESPVKMDESPSRDEMPSLASRERTPEEKVDHVEKQASIAISGTSVKKKKAGDASFASSGKGTHWVQLASLKTREGAEREWRRLIALPKLKSLLLGLKPVYNRVDMGESEGVRYRLRVGLFSYEEAKSLCRKLRDQKVDCMVKKS